MVDFFIGLFGGLYYGAKAIGEYSAEKKYLRESADRKRIYEDFLSRVVDWRFAAEIKEKMRDPANAEWVREQTEDVLCMLPDGAYTKASWDEFHDKLWIIMAKNGRLAGGSPGCNPYCDTPSGMNIYRRRNALAKWICEELERHGVDVVVAEDCTSFVYLPRTYAESIKAYKIVNWDRAVV